MTPEPIAGAVIYAADAARLSDFYARLNGFAVLHADDEPVFYVPDLAAARRVARELGGALKSVDDEWRFQDSIVCDGYDPEGNIFQLRQRVVSC